MRLDRSPLHGPEKAFQCSLCEREAEACWGPAKAPGPDDKDDYFYVCSHCAENTLPRVMAEALTRGGRRPGRETRAHMEAVFWKAVSHTLLAHYNPGLPQNELNEENEIIAAMAAFPENRAKAIKAFMDVIGKIDDGEDCF